MKADNWKTIDQGKKKDQSSAVRQALKKAARQILSQNHKERTRNSSTESRATIYELPKIRAPLNVQHFKTYELKKSMNIKAPLKCP